MEHLAFLRTVTVILVCDVVDMCWDSLQIVAKQAVLV